MVRDAEIEAVIVLVIAICLTVFACTCVIQSQSTERLKFTEHYVQVPVYQFSKSEILFSGKVWQREVEPPANFLIVPPTHLSDN